MLAIIDNHEPPNISTSHRIVAHFDRFDSNTTKISLKFHIDYREYCEFQPSKKLNYGTLTIVFRKGKIDLSIVV